MVGNHTILMIGAVLISVLLAGCNGSAATTTTATAYALAASVDDGHEDHHYEHYEDEWEWVGLFEVINPALRHTLLLQKAGMVSDDPDFTLHMIVVQTSTGDKNGLEQAHLEAEEIHEHQNATQVSGGTISIAMDTLYQISPSADSWLTNLNIDFPNAGYFAVFLEHGIEELCSAGEDCLRDSAGNILEPLFVEEAAHGNDSHEEVHADWGNTIAGTVAVWSAVFSGVVLLSGGVSNYEVLTGVKIHFISMFAAGALLATAFCLILLEASHLMASSDRSEAEVSGIWGATILAGFSTATIIDIVKDLVLYESGTVSPAQDCQTCEAIKSDKEDYSVSCSDKPSVCEHEKAIDVVETNNGVLELGSSASAAAAAAAATAAADEESNIIQVNSELNKQLPAQLLKESKPAKNVNGLIVSIVAGDFLHNFCDGVFIGAAFQSCSTTLGWTIVATTMCHEFAQEIADFVILTKRAGISIPKALIVNALSGFSVILGGIVISASTLSNLSIGVLLAFGSGNYIYLAASELYPSIHSSATEMSLTHKVVGFGIFVLGACAVGLVLLNHEHCEAGSSSGDSAGGVHDSHGH